MTTPHFLLDDVYNCCQTGKASADILFINVFGKIACNKLFVPTEQQSCSVLKGISGFLNPLLASSLHISIIELFKKGLEIDQWFKMTNDKQPFWSDDSTLFFVYVTVTVSLLHCTHYYPLLKGRKMNHSKPLKSTFRESF